MRALILEDNRDRRVAMIGRLAERFPFLHVTFFDAAEPMIRFMKSDPIQDVVLISLDHDLEMLPGSNGDWVDPGTGLDVARWLAERPKPLCPVVVHTTNASAGDKMMRLLKKSRWVSQRVIPHDGLHWIDSEWFPIIRNAIVEFAPQPSSRPILPEKSKVSLIRSLLADRHESGQAFCRTATARIADTYVRELRQMLDHVSLEIISLANADAFVSVLDEMGPIFHLIRDKLINPVAVLHAWAAQGPLAPDQLGLGESEAKQLSQTGVQQLQVTIIEIAEMQALLIMSANRSLAMPAVQALIHELKEAVEIAIFIGLNWPPSSGQPELTQESDRVTLP